MLGKIIQIILWLLAFFGIAFLVLLGAVLLLIILLLFVPIRYRGDFKKDADSLTVRARGSWLLQLIRVKVEYEKELLIRAYVLCFKVFDSAKPVKEKKQKVVKKTKKQETEKEAEKEAENKADTDSENEADKENAEADIRAVAETAVEADAEKDRAADIEVDAEADIENPAGEKKEEIPEQVVQKKSFFEKLRIKVENILCKIRGIYDRIKEVVNHIGYYLELLRADETKAVFGKSMSRLLKVLKSIRPRKLIAELVVGTGSPDTTGYVMALAGMMYPYLGRHVNIEPDFEKTIFEGKITFKGHVTIFVLLWQALRIYFDKDLRTLLGKLKREDA